MLLTDMIYLKKDLKTEADPKKVLDLALEAGRILLKTAVRFPCGGDDQIHMRALSRG